MLGEGNDKMRALGSAVAAQLASVLAHNRSETTKLYQVMTLHTYVDGMIATNATQCQMEKGIQKIGKSRTTCDASGNS